MSIDSCERAAGAVQQARRRSAANAGSHVRADGGSQYTNVTDRQTLSIHRVTVTYFRSISMPAGFRRHLVGKSLRNVCYSAVT